MSSEYVLEKFEHSGFTVKIIQDEDAQSPDNDQDLFLVTTRNRYFDVQRKGFDLDSIRDGEHAAEYDHFPLFAYVHSGVALSLGRGGQFSDPWDSGQIGFVLVKKPDFPEPEKAAESLVEEWNQYLRGDVWGAVVESPDGEQLDSCWGFYGSDYAHEEGKLMAESCAAQAAKVDRMEREAYAL